MSSTPDQTPTTLSLRLHDLSLRRLRPPRPAAVRYAWSVAVWVAAYVFTVVLSQYIERATFVFFWVAVLFAAWYGGFVPAVLAAVFAVFAVHSTFARSPSAPAGNVLGPLRAADLLTLLIFAVASLLVSALTAKLARAQRRAEADARELANLANALQDQASELEQQTEQAQVLAEELEQTNHDLEARTADAEAANRAKGEFLAVMSHELRTPLNAVLGYTDLLALGVGGPVTDAQREYLQRLEGSARHLLLLVTDVLDLAKLEARRFAVVHEPVDACAAAASALTFVAPQADAKGLELVHDCPEGGLSCIGDEGAIRQVIVNLLSNAVKFTEAGGRVEVRCTVDTPPPGRLRVDRSWSVVRVRDTGVGIPREHHEAVFAPFHQVDQGLTRGASGTGLGLAISRELARRMGGDLTVESEPGEGSTFSLWIPTSAAVEAPGIAEMQPAGAESRSDGRDGDSLVAAGMRLRSRAENVLEAFVARMQTDHIVSSVARSRTNTELENHYLSFLSDLAQVLIIVGESPGGEGELLRDGSEIQRTVATLHGEQRYRLGWTETQLVREHELLEEEVLVVLSRPMVTAGDSTEATDGTDGAEGTPTALARRLMKRVGELSLRAYRRVGALEVES